MFFIVDFDILILELVIKRFVVFVISFLIASLLILVFCFSFRLLYLFRFFFLGVERRLSVVFVIIVLIVLFVVWNIVVF